MEIQKFFESIWGQLIVLIVILSLFTAILYSGKGKRIDVKTLAVSALLVALSLVLGMITVYKMPQGGSVTLFSTVPIVLCAYIFGVRVGLMSGIIVGLLNLIIGPFVIHPIQLLLDYPLAYGALALGGIFAGGRYGLVQGYAFGLLCRYFVAVLSGIIFFGAYAPEGFNSVTWSLWYNATYLSVEGIASIIILRLPPVYEMFARMKMILPPEEKQNKDSSL